MARKKKPAGMRHWKPETHCPPQDGERILHPHVFTPVGDQHREWLDPWNLRVTWLEACRCGADRTEARTLNYGIDLALIEHGLTDTVVHYVDVDES